MRFYGHFAAAYGTCWLAMLVAALVLGSNVNAGAVGFFGFPAVSFIYAVGRRRRDASETEVLKTRIRVLEGQLARNVFGDGDAQ
jgi:hypothetical protein